MSSFSTEPTQPFEYMAIVVDDVDTASRTIHAKDRTGSIVQISFRDQAGGLFYVPSAGEKWIAVRKGYTWFLDQQLDDSDSSLALAPGDLAITAPGQLYIQGQPYGALTQDYFDHAAIDGGFASVVLSRTPGSSESIEVFLNGLLLVPALWTFDPPTRTITFVATMGEIGSLLVRYQ